MPTDITVPGPGVRADRPAAHRLRGGARRRARRGLRPARRPPRRCRSSSPSSACSARSSPTVLLAGTEELVFADAIAVDGPALFLQGTLAVLGLASVLLISERSLDSSGGAVVARAAVLPGSREDAALAEATEVQTEIYPLAMFSLGGMMLFPASNNLLLMFVALEVLSLPLYLMAGLARRRRLLSQEAAVKYFLLGAFASAFFLYGVALLYGYAGSVDLGEVFDGHRRRPAATRGCCSSAWRCWRSVCCSRSARCRSRPGRPTSTRARRRRSRRSWRPAPRSRPSARCCACFYVGFGRAEWDWRPMLWAVAIITMVVGGVLAVTQTDVKRMLAYSSVAHTGFLLVGVVALSPQGLSGTLFYLLAYGFTTLAVFAVVTLVRDSAARRPTSRSGPGLGTQEPAGRRHLRLPAVRARRHPAHERLHGQVRRVHRRRRGRRHARWSSSASSRAPSRPSSTPASSCSCSSASRPLDGPTVAVPSVFTAGGDRRSASPSRSCSACCRSRSSTSPSDASRFVS